MRIFSRLIFIFFLIACILFLTAKNTQAEGEFKTDYKVRYQIDKNGLTQVTQNITLKNQTPNYYADKFELKIGATKVTNVKAHDETGDLDTNVKFENNITTINIKFNQRVIGADKTLSWTLTYETNEIATKSGQIWEISIPKIAKSQDIGQYDAVVAVPKIFGPSAFEIPTPLSKSQTLQYQEFSFNKDQLLTSGISMSFGDKQVFSYNLNYQLENSNLNSQTFDISLPPDNNYQKVVLEKIEPKPLDVVVDDDGNFLAKFKLKPKEKLSVVVVGQVEVFSKPFRKINQTLTDNQKIIYTQPQRYWETDNAFIKDKAQELKTPQKIYEFVSNYLSYNNDRLNEAKIERKGAASAYSSPKDSVCMEFTDLFIAVARAAKIPAREVEGYAYTQNERLRPLSLNLYEGDVLHAWPEYWDNDKGWVQIDPTWGSTSGGLDYFSKLDFNHITFVQRGFSSIHPSPAGAFRFANKPNEKTVFVQFAQDLPQPTTTARIDVQGPAKAYASFPFNVKATLLNTGTTSILGKQLTVNANGLQSPNADTFDIPLLPPYAKKEYTFSFRNNGIYQKLDSVLVISYAGIQVTKSISVLPIYRILQDRMFLFSLGTALFIIATGLLLYKKTHKKHKFLF
jgi:hypothetical protein